MTNHKLSLPVWQSRALLCAGLAALGAAALGSGVYAFQSASASQLLRLTQEIAIPTDAITKTVLSFSAELGVAFGAVVTAWLWRTGRKGLRLQAWLAMVMTAWALAISVGNLSGYFAWTRAQHVAETARASESYRVASDRREAGAYLRRRARAWRHRQGLRSAHPRSRVRRRLQAASPAQGQAPAQTVTGDREAQTRGREVIAAPPGLASGGAFRISEVTCRLRRAINRHGAHSL
jgi:hypothetical protein